MAFQVVVTKGFTEDMKATGEELLKALDKEGFQVVSCFWSYFPEAETWRLVIVTPEVRRQGPTKVYEFIRGVVSKMPVQIGLQDVGVLDPSDELANLMRKVVRTGTGISGIRFANNVINGRLMEDAYIYRMN